MTKKTKKRHIGIPKHIGLTLKAMKELDRLTKMLTTFAGCEEVVAKNAILNLMRSVKVETMWYAGFQGVKQVQCRRDIEGPNGIHYMVREEKEQLWAYVPKKRVFTTKLAALKLELREAKQKLAAEKRKLAMNLSWVKSREAAVAKKAKAVQQEMKARDKERA
jgi:hypothetical protein